MKKNVWSSLKGIGTEIFYTFNPFLMSPKWRVFFNGVYSNFSDQVERHLYWKSSSSWPPLQNGRLECCSVTEISIFKVQNVPNLRRVYGNLRGKILTWVTPSCILMHEGVSRVRIFPLPFPYKRLRFGTFSTLKINISVTEQHSSLPFWNGGQLDKLFQ